MLHLWVQMPSPWSKSRPTYHAIASFQVVETMKFPNPDLESRNPANPRLGQVWHYRFEAAMPAGDIDSSRPLHCFAQILEFFINFWSKSTTSRRGWHFPVIGGISRSLAGISRSTPPGISRSLAGISRSLVFAILAVFTNSWFFIKFCSKSTTSRRGWHFPVIGGISRSLAGISRSTSPAFPDHWLAFPGHWFFAILAVFPNFCKWCFRLQVRLAGSPNDRFCCCHPKKKYAVNHWHPHWLNFPKQWRQLHGNGLNCSSKSMIREIKSSIVNQELCLRFCLFQLAPCYALRWLRAFSLCISKATNSEIMAKILAETETLAWTYPHLFVPGETSPDLLDLNISTQQGDPGTDSLVLVHAHEPQFENIWNKQSMTRSNVTDCS